MPTGTKNQSTPEEQELEGVIKFNLLHREAPLPFHSGFPELNDWRNLLYELGLTGQDSSRYGGLGYGNMSMRTGDSQFLISGSQTGGIRTLGTHHYVGHSRRPQRKSH